MRRTGNSDTRVSGFGGTFAHGEEELQKPGQVQEAFLPFRCYATTLLRRWGLSRFRCCCKGCANGQSSFKNNIGTNILHDIHVFHTCTGVEPNADEELYAAGQSSYASSTPALQS